MPDLSRPDAPVEAPATQALVAAAQVRSSALAGTAGAAGRAVLDTVGVAIAARCEPAVRILDAYLGEEEPSRGTAAVWSRGRTTSPAQAALVNGTAAHALDWDDASPTAAMHPSAVLVPALLANLGGADAVDLVDALDAGNAVFRGVSEALDLGRHMDEGWHNTATTGRLAAVVALCRLRRLDADATRRALGIVASFTAGSLANFGTMTKPLHAGAAAADAVRACALAARGFDAAPAEADHPKGFFASFGVSSPTATADLDARLRHWRAAWPEDVAVKQYPSCYGTHRAIDAVLASRPELGDPSAVQTIDVHIHPGGRRPLLAHLPRTGLEGKFSLEYTIARALVSGGITLADFTDERVLDPSIDRLMRSITVTEREQPPAGPGAPSGPARFAVVQVRRSDGTTLERRVDVTHGDARDPLSETDLVEKFVGATAHAGMTRAASQELAGHLLGLTRDAPATDLQERLAHAGTDRPEAS